MKLNLRTSAIVIQAIVEYKTEGNDNSTNIILKTMEQQDFEDLHEPGMSAWDFAEEALKKLQEK